jgi:hypothetical protein
MMIMMDSYYQHVPLYSSATSTVRLYSRYESDHGGCGPPKKRIAVVVPVVGRHGVGGDSILGPIVRRADRLVALLADWAVVGVVVDLCYYCYYY